MRKRGSNYSLEERLMIIKDSPVPEFLDQTKKAIYLWDDNIMGSADFDSIIDELIATGKRFQFR